MLRKLSILSTPSWGQSTDLLIIAGEHSGDQQAARVVAQMREAQPDLRIAAIGGPELEKAGAELMYDLTESSVVGLFEVLKNYSFFKELFRDTLIWIKMCQPKAICFVDYPGFNLRLAEALFKRGLSQKGGGDIRLLYYISPQIWAWKPKRRFKMAKYLDALGVIFPFEVKCFEDTALPTTFVGHPFADPDYVLNIAYDKEGAILLLPGSRKTPVARIFPILLDAYELFLKKYPSEPAVVVYPSEEIYEVLRRALAKKSYLRPHITFKSSEEAIAGKAVLMSSGTMSLKCTLACIPGAIVYRANPLTYLIGKMIVDIEHLGIANILLNETVYPEYIQGDAKPQSLMLELEDCIHNPLRAEEAHNIGHTVRTKLTQEAQCTAAEWLLSLMN